MPRSRSGSARFPRRRRRHCSRARATRFIGAGSEAAGMGGGGGRRRGAAAERRWGGEVAGGAGRGRGRGHGGAGARRGADGRQGPAWRRPVRWRRRRRSPEVGEAAAPERRKRRGGAGSRGPLLGLPGRDGGGDAVPRGHVAAAGWMAAAGGRCPVGSGHVRRWRGSLLGFAP